MLVKVTICCILAIIWPILRKLYRNDDNMVSKKNVISGDL